MELFASLGGYSPSADVDRVKHPPASEGAGVEERERGLMVTAV